MKGFGIKIKELRTQMNLSQKELGNEIGCVQSVVCYWENDIVEPSISNLKALCELFDVSADYLLGLSEF